MYEYRSASPDDRVAMLERRRRRGFPLHAPPHFLEGKKTYLITAAISEHQPWMADEDRRSELAKEMLDGMRAKGWLVFAWVVLPNHYHFLANVDLDGFAELCRRKHSSLATRWNRQDRKRGKVWYRYSERKIRSEGHFLGAMNYVFLNPVKHGYVSDPFDWLTSSLHDAERCTGRSGSFRSVKGIRVKGWGMVGMIERWLEGRD